MLSLYPLTDKKEDRPIFETSRSRIQIGVHLKAIGLIVVFDNLFPDFVIASPKNPHQIV
ncbi:MAG: hypothetical protein E7L36_09275 [Prevotella bivia]|nr:hypothetical protein [Prevotella bivia]